jgi:hypothetical protein
VVVYITIRSSRRHIIRIIVFIIKTILFIIAVIFAIILVGVVTLIVRIGVAAIKRGSIITVLDSYRIFETPEVGLIILILQ